MRHVRRERADDFPGDGDVAKSRRKAKRADPGKLSARAKLDAALKGSPHDLFKIAR